MRADGKAIVPPNERPDPMSVTARHEQVLAEFNALRAAGVRADGHPLGEATLRALDHDIARLEALLTQGA